MTTDTNSISIKHLAFIMDGNRRFAVSQGQNKLEGHRQGLENLHRLLEHIRTLDIQQVSVYALSTENWNRDKKEVDALLQLIDEMLNVDRRRLLGHQVQIRFVGDLFRFSENLQHDMTEIEQQTAQYTKTVFICLSYGGRLEMVEAARILAQAGGPYTEDGLAGVMWSHNMNDIDLLIRTGGDHRLSNFLPWQTAYAELYFTDTLWPAFSTDELDQIIANYRERVRINKGV